MAVIVSGRRKIPFLRGMLAHYLIEHGFSFRDAYQVADGVRSTIQKRKDISPEKMIDVVRLQVRGLFGDRPIGNGIFWEPRPKQLVVEDENGRRPFSRGRLSQSLIVSGLDDSRAYSLAEQIGAEFLQKRKTAVHGDDIRKAALSTLRRECGAECADRYRVWHRFRTSTHPKPLIVLLGGASGVGKTSVGVAVASRLRISRVSSTDEIRQVMRLMIAPDLMPALHASSFAASEHLSAPLPPKQDPAVYAFREQATHVCVGVRATIERAIDENVSLIVDGVHLLPDLLGVESFGKKALFIWMNLYLPDREPYVDRFEQRSDQAKRRPQHRYLKYLEQILKIQDHILEVGAAHNVPAVENAEFDETVQFITLHIMDVLRAEVGKKK